MSSTVLRFLLRSVPGRLAIGVDPRNKGEGMVWQRIRLALWTGCIVALAALPARANDCAAPAPCGSRTVCCTEWVLEKFQTTRTVYKHECKEERYTAYRCECVPENRTRTCTVYKRVMETKTETRNVCVCVPTCEERTVMEKHWTCKPVTVMVKKCVDKGHYECREVECQPSFFERLKKCCKKDCCDDCCPKTKIVKVWVPCKVIVECPVTRMQRVCECRPVTCKVTVNKMVHRQEQVQVCCWKCVPECKTETYQVMVMKKVPFEATRKVVCCVPVQETVTCTRLVPRKVERQIDCCPTTCCPTTCCKQKKCCR